MASVTAGDDGDGDIDPIHELSNPRDLQTQATVSVALGLIAFLFFCFFRTRWPGLYAARRKHKNEAAKLPQLPDSFFGWMPVLWRITDEEILASAGLDAYVFLAFFKMAVKFLAVVLFFSLTVTYPIHKTIGAKAHQSTGDGSRNGGELLRRSLEKAVSSIQSIPALRNVTSQLPQIAISRHAMFAATNETKGNDTAPAGSGQVFANDYLWIYVVFVYVYSALAVYLIIVETNRIIHVRQRYLGVQSSLTDRTIRLSGIPPHLRSEDKIKETIETLEIGKVDTVMLCRNWRRLDDMMAERAALLRKLEEAWTTYLGYHGDAMAALRTKPSLRAPHRGSEDAALMENGDYSSEDSGPAHVSTVKADRPTTCIWYGFWHLQHRRVDAIDYYESRVKALDESIEKARNDEYAPTPLAFVTLDSIASCQMAIQAILDPVPMQLTANPSPAPEDVVWTNTYLSRRQRMTRAWSVTLLVLLLTFVWFSILAPFAALINLRNLYKVFPGLEGFLEAHKVLQSLIRTGLPTAVLSILNALVPYLYDWLSNQQGMTSQGDIEMSVISKNFFFTFFTLFVAFTLFGTAANAYAFGRLAERLHERLGDVFGTAFFLAKALESLGAFYMNLIVLQAFGLLPLRLLEFGSVFTYPIWLIGAKTPRDFDELAQPPIFSYGFFLPQTIFIFTICIIYSILPDSHLVALFGLVYFVFGHFIYKYQLLYAMDHHNFSSGRAWPMICNRIIVGLVFFQIAMAGQLLLEAAWRRSALVLPLLVGTLWFALWYQRTFGPLTRFIALRSLHDTHDEAASLSEVRQSEGVSRSRSPRDSDRNAKFINPSLVCDLEDIWISRAHAEDAERSHVS